MTTQNQKNNNWLISASIIISAVIIADAWLYTAGFRARPNQSQTQPLSRRAAAADALEEKVLPSRGIILPVRWGDLGAKMISVGVIDGEKIERLYMRRGGLDDETKKMLYGQDNGNIKITSENSGLILNLLWALGLGTKNDILTTGEMANPRYGGAGTFASTAGWTLAAGDVGGGAAEPYGAGAMDHYSRHPFVVLTPEQQKLVELVSKNIYRPCCNNSTHFPDCNHGMAMLGLLELMASQGASEEEMYRVALQVNSFWFPDTYLTIAKYLESKGVSWGEANPKEILGYNYSSASGYRQILSQVTLPAPRPSGGCGV